MNTEDRQETQQWLSGIPLNKSLITALTRGVPSLKGGAVVVHNRCCYEGHLEQAPLKLHIVAPTSDCLKSETRGGGLRN